MRHNSILFLFLLTAPAFAGGVKVVFDPAKPEIGPFPTDYLTAPATNTKTARRVRMPAPSDCSVQPNACQEAWFLSDFDGFNLQARVNIRFSGPVNPDSIKDGVYLVAGPNLTTDEAGAHKLGDVIRLNRIVFDPVTNTAYGKPDVAMDQHRQYVLVITDAMKDEAGDPVEADDPFTSCITAAVDDYCKALSDALKPLAGINIAGASLFTTMSATAWLEKARDALQNTPPTLTRPDGKSFFSIDSISLLNVRQQTAVSPVQFEDFDLTFGARLIAEFVVSIGFGSFNSPNYVRGGLQIDASPSAAALPDPVSVEQVHFHALMPRAAKPAGGYPVVIYGHGLSDSRFGGPSALSPAFGSQGMATIAISAMGHGYGPASHVQIRDAGTRIDVAAPGRGVDLNGDGRIGGSEGCGAISSSPIGFRDCLRQTTVDLLQLVRLIKSGLDIDGDGTPDFDGSKIYYAGQSLGAMYGTMFLAVEPDVKRAVLNAGGGSVVDISRWSPVLKPVMELNFFLRRPSLLNNGNGFDESYVLRNQPAKVVTTPGAIDIQNTIETLEWLQAEGDPASYAVHLKTSPLKGVSQKSILWQFPIGDQSIPNNTQSALIRYADMLDFTWIYRHDVARGVSPFLDANPHTYLTNVLSPFWFGIARATQTQVTLFLSNSDIIDPNLGTNFNVKIFEQPAELPEDLNFLEP
jgi:hypothetical protein